VARRTGEKGLVVEIVFLTMHKDEDVFNEAMDAGAKGYVVKESATNDIVQSIRAVAAGRNFISPELSTYLVSRGGRAASAVRRKPGLDALTATEARVLKLIAENKTSRQIASDLGVSVRTIENHRANISTKLELRGAHVLLKFALEHKSSL
jgi:DNA-binding NarL/FixJ family response regulator